MNSGEPPEMVTVVADEQHYATVVSQLTGDERRVVGSIMHAARMAVAMKQGSRVISPPPAAIAR
jgi:hypothetical protein